MPKRAAPPPTVLASVATALLVDLADLITFGLVGVWTGFALGAVLGWLLAPQLGFPERRWFPAVLSGAYCMLPGTALMPLAAILTAFRAWSARAESARPVRIPKPEAGGAIEAEYEASWQAKRQQPQNSSRD